MDPGGGMTASSIVNLSAVLNCVVDPDVIAHSFDLQHGVEVASGRRVSVIFWFTDNKESCLSKARPWYSAAAEQGNADAQFVEAANVYGEDPEHNAEQAQQLLRAAAVQGHFVAQNELGTMLLRGLGSKESRPDRMEVLYLLWLIRTSSEQNSKIVASD